MERQPRVVLQDIEAQDGEESGRGRGQERDSEESLDMQTEDEDAFVDTQEAFYASSRSSRGSNDTSVAQPLLAKRQE